MVAVPSKGPSRAEFLTWCVAIASRGPLVSSRLYGLSPTDPLTITVAAAGLTVVAALATALPAYRASRVDPLAALRYE